MITEIGRKIKRIVRPGAAKQAPGVAKTTYYEKGNQWYVPGLVGPSTFITSTVGAKAVRDVLTVFSKLSPDEYLTFVRNFYEAGLERFGDQWVYADINTALLGLSKGMQPQSYLEIGVRRGRSMAMVASQQPDCHIVGFDLWIENYAGMENPGKDFVKGELERVGFKGEARFVDGDSRVTVPQYFKEHPGEYFDIITVDGDHTLEGARIDIMNVLPRLKIGGALVFDDISNQDHSYLNGLWEELFSRSNQFASYSFTEVGFGIAFAIKKY